MRSTGRVALWTVIASAVAGCVPYPIYKTLQPEAQMRVLDAAGQPLEGANVALIASAYPYGFERSREFQPTDAAGAARFQRRSEWRSEIFFIHGAEEYFWNWCVRKNGYLTHETAYRSTPFDSDATAVLAAGESQPCRPAFGLPRPKTTP